MSRQLARERRRTYDGQLARAFVVLAHPPRYRRRSRVTSWTQGQQRASDAGALTCTRTSHDERLLQAGRCHPIDGVAEQRRVGDGKQRLGRVTAGEHAKAAPEPTTQHNRCGDWHAAVWRQVVRRTRGRRAMRGCRTKMCVRMLRQEARSTTNSTLVSVQLEERRVSHKHALPRHCWLTGEAVSRAPSPRRRRRQRVGRLRLAWRRRLRTFRHVFQQARAERLEAASSAWRRAPSCHPWEALLPWLLRRPRPPRLRRRCQRGRNRSRRRLDTNRHMPSRRPAPEACAGAQPQRLVRVYAPRQLALALARDFSSQHAAIAMQARTIGRGERLQHLGAKMRRLGAKVWSRSSSKRTLSCKRLARLADVSTARAGEDVFLFIVGRCASHSRRDLGRSQSISANQLQGRATDRRTLNACEADGSSAFSLRRSFLPLKLASKQRSRPKASPARRSSCASGAHNTASAVSASSVALERSNVAGSSLPDASSCSRLQLRCRASDATACQRTSRSNKNATRPCAMRSTAAEAWRCCPAGNVSAAW